MAFIRWSEDSDVYVWDDGRNIHVWLNETKFRGNERDAVIRLMKLRDAGFKVPNEVIEIMAEEANKLHQNLPQGRKEKRMETDHTPAIFAVLDITPETHPKLYLDIDSKRPCYSLLSGTLEADGLAVSLVGIATKDSTLSINLWPWRRDTWYVQCVDGLQERETCNKYFAHAVHDALVEALGINKEGERE